MVATPWDGQAARKDFLLHEGSEIKCAASATTSEPVYRWAAVSGDDGKFHDGTADPIRGLNLCRQVQVGDSSQSSIITALLWQRIA
jgi:hypothetical protein